MKKDVVTQSDIRQDLSRIPRFYRCYAVEWRHIGVMLITPIAILAGLLFESLLVGLLVFSTALYHVVRFVMTCIRCAKQKKVIENACENGELSISIQRIRHVVTDKIYEPHLGTRGRFYFYKEICIFEFDSLHWRVPEGYYRHYEWSEEYCVGPDVLKNAAVRDAEFICVTVKGHPDIAYVYPCQFFVLDKSLPCAEKAENIL